MQLQHLPYTPLRITSKFGPRNTGIPRASTYHQGVDIGCDWARPGYRDITAVLPGTVISNYYNSARGWVILIDHGTIDGRNVKTLYQHLKQAGTAKGARVKAGDTIGTMGATGVGAQLHLHFEVRLDNAPVDPEPYLNNIKKPEEIDMTKEEVVKLIQDTVKEILMGRGTAPSAWAEGELKEAVAAGIMDGTRPGGYCTREQAAIMTYRAAKKG